ncbi:hypothetical protein ACFQ6E_39055 [Streptomyces sp. NPDC056462]|uniref:hypothetical protein n=1 Tax=Streptomyces sp. NPDC056462 TaxID=3345826 RepID=UPI0036C3845F
MRRAGWRRGVCARDTQRRVLRPPHGSPAPARSHAPAMLPAPRLALAAPVPEVDDVDQEPA